MTVLQRNGPADHLVDQPATTGHRRRVNQDNGAILPTRRTSSQFAPGRTTRSPQQAPPRPNRGSGGPNCPRRGSRTKSRTSLSGLGPTSKKFIVTGPIAGRTIRSPISVSMGKPWPIGPGRPTRNSGNANNQIEPGVAPPGSPGQGGRARWALVPGSRPSGQENSKTSGVGGSRGTTPPAEDPSLRSGKRQLRHHGGFQSVRTGQLQQTRASGWLSHLGAQPGSVCDRAAGDCQPIVA